MAKRWYVGGSLLCGLLLAGGLLIANCKSPTSSSAGFSYPSMKLIQGVTFHMGSDSLQNVDAQPKHKVTISSYYIDTIEVTQHDYKALMGLNPSVNTTNGDLCPVDNVSWYDAVLYCNTRSKHDNLDTVYSYDSCIVDASSHVCTSLGHLNTDFTKKGYRLPTEAEWEWAAKGGLDHDWLFSWTGSDNLDAYDWYATNSNGTSHPVATKFPNGFGLYDMLGNIYEWVNDWWENWPDASWPTDTSVAVVNPHGPATSSSTTAKQMRGGSYQNTDEDIWLADRDDMCSPDLAQARNGFRCAATK